MSHGENMKSQGCGPQNERQTLCATCDEECCIALHFVIPPQIEQKDENENWDDLA